MQRVHVCICAPSFDEILYIFKTPDSAIIHIMSNYHPIAAGTNYGIIIEVGGGGMNPSVPPPLYET